MGTQGGPTVSWGSGGQPRGTTSPSLLPTTPACSRRQWRGLGWGLHRLGQACFSLLPQKPHVLFSERKQICCFTKKCGLNLFFILLAFICYLCSSCLCSAGEVSEMPQQWGNGVRGKNLHVNVLDGQFLMCP